MHFLLDTDLYRLFTILTIITCYICILAGEHFQVDVNTYTPEDVVEEYEDEAHHRRSRLHPSSDHHPHHPLQDGCSTSQT